MNNDQNDDLGQPPNMVPLAPIDPSVLLQNYQSPYLAIAQAQTSTFDQPDFLFPKSAEKTRSLFERTSYSTGLSFLLGSFAGSSWGVVEGLRHPAARTNRLRLNTVLNAVSKRGPFVGNTLAVISVMFHSINAGVIKARGGQDDHLNMASAGIATGALFRSPSGPRATVMGALTGFGLVAAYYVGRMLLFNEDIPISLPSYKEDLPDQPEVVQLANRDDEELR